MARKTKAEALETRHQILDAAEQVFLRQGVARTSLQQIAESAGVTRGAVYWHFENKSALFHAMMERVLLPCECALETAERATADNLLQALAAMALMPLRELAQRPHVQRVFTIAMHLTEYNDELQEALQRQREGIAEYVEALQDTIARAQAAGLISVEQPPAVAARGLFALIDGLMHHWTQVPEQFDLLAVGRAGIVNWLRGQGAQAPEAVMTALEAWVAQQGAAAAAGMCVRPPPGGPGER